MSNDVDPVDKGVKYKISRLNYQCQLCLIVGYPMMKLLRNCTQYTIQVYITIVILSIISENVAGLFFFYNLK